MLQLLLNEIRAGGTLEAKSLAIKLGTTPQLMEAMLEHLQRAGYIKNYASCGDDCQGCGLRDACGTPKRDLPHLWQSNPDI